MEDEKPAHTNDEVIRLCRLIRGYEIEQTTAATVQTRNLRRILTHQDRGRNVVLENRVEALNVLRECFIERNVDWQEHVGLIPVALDTLNFLADYLVAYNNDDDDDQDDHDHDAHDDKEMAYTCLGFFRAMAATHPRFFDLNLHQVLDTMVEILKDESVVVAIRINVAWVINEMAISRNESRLKRLLFKFIVRLLEDLDDIHQWQTERNQLAGWSWNVVVGAVALEIIASSLSEDIASDFVRMIPENLINENWKRRHATLLAFSKIGDRCHQLITNVMDQIVPMVVSAFNDDHSRVRYMAVKCIGILYGSKVPGEWRHRCLPTVILPVAYALEDAENPMIQEAATESASKLIPTCNPQLLKPYLVALLKPLRPLIVGPPGGRRLNACRALAELAQAAALSSQDAFAIYNDMMIPEVTQILTNAGERSKAVTARKFMRGYVRNQVNIGQWISEGCKNIWKKELRRRRLLAEARARAGEGAQPQP